jgi:predicted RNA-binding protein
VADADVWCLPLLSLAGADLFGDSHARSSAASAEMLFESYSVEVGDVRSRSCPCPVCREEGVGKNLGDHNGWVMSKVLAEMRNRIAIGEIKLMAEERSIGHPEASAALKDLYHDYGDYLEKHTTIIPGVRT